MTSSYKYFQSHTSVDLLTGYMQSATETFSIIGINLILKDYTTSNFIHLPLWSDIKVYFNDWHSFFAHLLVNCTDMDCGCTCHSLRITHL